MVYIKFSQIGSYLSIPEQSEPPIPPKVSHQSDESEPPFFSGKFSGENRRLVAKTEHVIGFGD